MPLLRREHGTTRVLGVHDVFGWPRTRSDDGRFGGRLRLRRGMRMRPLSQRFI